MILECYFDDSSDPQREKYFACGGLLANQEHWDAFELLWSHQTYGLKEPFRATQCECGHGQFADEKEWPKSKRDALMARLTGIIREIDLLGFAAVVPIKEFRRAFPFLGGNDAFALAVTHTVFAMCDIAHKVDMDASLWFEHGNRNGTVLNLQDSLRGLDWKPGQRLKSVAFGTKQLRPLQAADLIAREAFKHMDNLGERPTRIPIRRLFENVFFMLWTGDSLRHLATNGWPHNLESILAFSNPPPDAKIQHFWKKSWEFHEQRARRQR